MYIVHMSWNMFDKFKCLLFKEIKSGKKQLWQLNQWKKRFETYTMTSDKIYREKKNKTCDAQAFLYKVLCFFSFDYVVDLRVKKLLLLKIISWNQKLNIWFKSEMEAFSESKAFFVEGAIS